SGIESRIATLVGSKQAFFKGLFDGDTDSVQFEQSGSFLSKVQQMYEGAVAATTGGPGEGDEIDVSDVNLDDDVADAFEPVLDAADESQDRFIEPVPERPLITPSPTPKTAAVESRDGSAGATRPAMPSSGDVRQLFSQLQIRRGDQGRIVIEAPPEAASTLSA